MSWMMLEYVLSTQELAAPVKDKAVELADALLNEGYEEDRAIPIAIAQAKKWAETTTVANKKAAQKTRRFKTKLNANNSASV
jgi:uncharacterized protein YdaT